MRDTDVRRRLLAAALSILGLALAPAAAKATTAVVLVSGFDTSSPFTTSAEECAGREGPTWGDPSGPAAALRAAGLAVFTAPVANTGAAPPPACLAAGQPAPPASATIDSNGDIDANGRALGELLGFLQSSYGVDTVNLVGHSAGGLWSRSAITQLASAGGPRVQSLTTLGTPHTGSFGADLAETLVNGQCKESNQVEQIVCEAVLAVIQAEFQSLGPTAIEQLTSTFLAGWNPQQQLGCPVAVMGGNWLSLPLFPLEYYNASDGIVGQASALGQRATSIMLQPIPAPGFQPVGSQLFPVVHSGSLTFLTPNTLLNQTDVSATAVAAVGAGAASAPCYQPPPEPVEAPDAVTPPPATVEPLPQPLQPRTARMPVVTRAGFRSIDTAGSGRRLPRQGRNAVVLLLDGASLRCQGRAVVSAPVLGSHRLSAAVPRCSERLRVRGGRALALQPEQGSALRIERSGRALTLRVTGRGLRGAQARVRIRGHWRPARLGRMIVLPKGTGPVAVRVVGRGRSGERESATAHVAD